MRMIVPRDLIVFRTFDRSANPFNEFPCIAGPDGYHVRKHRLSVQEALLSCRSYAQTAASSSPLPAIAIQQY